MSYRFYRWVWLTLCGLLVATAAQAEIPGRLFFTKEQRVLLDNARRQNVQLNTEQRAISSEMSFGGMVKRSDGRSTLWVNGRPITGQEASQSGTLATTTKQGQPVLRLPNPGQPVELKVGQRLDPLSGKAVEGYAWKSKNEPAASTAGKPAEAQTPPARHGEQP